MTDQDIIPGLMGLNLNILHAVDMHMIEDAKRIILKCIEKEHPIVSNVQKNLIALLKTRIPREKYQAKIDLEGILRQFPKHLNSLADLEEIYRDQHRISDAHRCRSTIDEILVSKNVVDMQAKQTCLLEQGYIILTERTLVNENTIELRISDLQRILKTEFEKCDGTRRECLERGLHYQIQVLRNVEKANEDNTVDGHLARKGSSLEKFEAAEKLNSLRFPHLIWIFYHAKALNQYYDSLELLSKYKNNIEEDLRTITIQAIEKFWNFVQIRHSSKMTKFIARSYAYIGHILTKRCYLLRSASDCKFLENPEFKIILKTPLTALRKAYQMAPNDVTVLNRFGRSLWNKSIVEKDEKQKQKYLEEANTILTDAELDRDWFTFSTRMIVRLNLADVFLKYKDTKSAFRYLHSAREDGIICFESKTTRRDTSVLAEVCQKLAKFPFTNEYRPENIKEKQYLHEALDFLEYANHTGDPPDYHWTNRMASILYDLGEYEQAIEWQRKAWFLSAPSNTHSFYILCLFLLTKFEQSNINDQSTNHVLREFLYIIIYAKTKYQDIRDTIERLYHKKKTEMLKVIKQILENPLGLRKDEKEVLSNCLEIFLKLSTGYFNRECQTLNSKLKDINPGQETDYELSEIFQGKSIKPLVKTVKPWSKDYKYDFFVSHCHKDGNWVENILLQNLESKFDNNDVVFKGCVADRDFTPGKSVLDNIIDAINNSNKVILVLTERFVSSNWCQYEADQAMMRSLNSKIDNCVVPVLLEECEIPQKVSLLNYVDLTSKTDFCREMRRLKMALLPGNE